MKAIVIGATGLVGRHMTEILLSDPRISEVLVFTRRQLPLSNPKLITRIVDFDKIEEWKDQVQGDVLFSALGTTLKTVGSKEAQYKIDHDYQLHVAQAAAANNVTAYVLISSVNASSKSPFFYLKMKGELEDKVRQLKFKSVFVLRPGPLKGHREKERLNEVLSIGILDHLPKFLVAPTMRPVDGEQVAKVSVKLGLSGAPGFRFVEAKEILNTKS
jgi:uncharacterized protein YbjT (DUF2867 family)